MLVGQLGQQVLLVAYAQVYAVILNEIELIIIDKEVLLYLVRQQILRQGVAIIQVVENQLYVSVTQVLKGQLLGRYSQSRSRRSSKGRIINCVQTAKLVGNVIFSTLTVYNLRGKVLKNINKALYLVRVVLFRLNLYQGLIIHLNLDFAAFYLVTLCLQGLYDRKGLTLLRQVTLLRQRKLIAYIRDGLQGQRVQYRLRNRYDQLVRL